MLQAVEKKDVVRRFSDLEVWKLSFHASLAIHKASLEFPKIEQYALADQIRRASKSVCANIAEGFSRQSGSKPEFKRFIQMAMGSANEVCVWLKYCRELGYISVERADVWDAEYDRICRMLNGLYHKS